MIKSRTNLNALVRRGVISLALLTGATTAMANASDRISLLEKEVKELKLRLANLESPQLTPSNRPKVVATKVGWKSLANWRSLIKEMSPDDVRGLLDEPITVRAAGDFTTWSYSSRGDVTFHQERVYGWTEPK